MKIKLTALLLFFCALGINAQNTFEGKYSRPLSDVLKDVGKEFNVSFSYSVDTTGLVLTYADFRIRHYSMEETMDNICKYFDFNWWLKNGKITIKPYEYARRHDEEGRKMLDFLSKKYSNSKEWEARREVVRRELREKLQIDTYMDSLVKKPQVILSKVRKYDGYTVQNICIETLPGEHLFGSIYSPAKKGKHALIICPGGHFYDGRYRKDQQQRLGSLARMGAICVDFDLYAWGECEAEHPKHNVARAHVMQALNGLVVLDWMVKNRAKDIDMTRIGVNGGSGGGTHSVLLAGLDERFTAAAPTVSLASHFDGGCPCESGMPIHTAAGGTCNAEILATMAPKPVLVVSDGGDWTASVPTIEFPYLQRVWGFYGANDVLTNVHLPKERHDFGPNKRNANYDFFIKVFNLDASMLDESKVTIEAYDLMKTNLYPNFKKK